MIDLLQVDHRREGVELLEHVVRPAILGPLGHRPVLVGRVAEDDRARRAGLRAGHRELVDVQVALLERGAVLGLLDALHAERALLHDAFVAHRDVRVELPVQRLREGVLRARRVAVAEPVVVADLVRAVVGAVARADAAVVDLHVEAVGRVVGRVHRADGLARRVAAVLAHHRDETRLEVRVLRIELHVLRFAVEFPVALEADPRHLARTRDVGAEAGAVRKDLRTLPGGTHRGDVVLGVTRRDACRTAGALGEVDRHRPATTRRTGPVVGVVLPLVLAVGDAQVALCVVRDRRAESRQELRARLPVELVRMRFFAGEQRGERDRLRDAAAVLTAGAFDGDDALIAARLGDRRLGVAERRRAGARVLATGKESPSVLAGDGVAAGCGLPTADLHCDRVGADADVHEGWRGEITRGGFHGDHITVDHTDRQRCLGVHLDDGLPDDLGDGIGQLLQPGLVRPASVAERRRGIGDQMVGAVLCAGRCRARRGPRCA